VLDKLLQEPSLPDGGQKDIVDACFKPNTSESIANCAGLDGSNGPDLMLTVVLLNTGHLLYGVCRT
jgi:hypothetical protein